MSESTRGGSRSSDTAEELASTLRAKARSAATTALREGLEEIDERHGQRVADEVANLIDVAEVFIGLTDPADHDVRVRGNAKDNRDDDDEPWEFKPLTRL